MDAIEFVKQLRRMDKYGGRKYSIFYDYPEDVVAEVEEWSKEHSRKTRQSVFLEQWPNVAVSEDGVIKIRPCNLDVNVKKGCLGVTCDYCRREFWMQEVE
nr:MAG TPA: hypothetical protein [Caudoviricetes sp.]